MISQLVPFVCTLFLALNILYACRLNYNGKKYTTVPIVNHSCDVTSMHLHRNQISTLEAYQFQNYKSLLTLDLSYNEISNVHDTAFHGLSALTRLYLHNNKLKAMPYLGYIENNIKWIHLHNNPNIKTVNFSQLQMPNLIYLNLQNTGLTSVPIYFSNAPELTELNIQSNNIEYIPNGYFEPFKKLKNLYISRNNVEDFDPVALSLPGTLQNLWAESIGLSNLTQGSFRNLTNLKQLRLRFNSLKEFNTTSLTYGPGFPQLTHLYLSQNKLDKIPSIGRISDSLQYLLVASITIDDIPADYFDDLDKLIWLELQDTGIQSFPQFNRNMTELRTLYLQSNKITYVDSHLFRHLPLLSILHLQNNQLRHFEIPHPGIRSLEYLYLGYNELREFPNITSSIKSIKYLHIQNNHIKEISMKTIYGSSITETKAENMVKLYMQFNEMDGHEIDDDIWRTMPKLQELQIHTMNLRVFPDLHPLEKLTRFWAHGNSFQSMGSLNKLKDIRKLSFLYLNQNNLSSIVNFVELAEAVSSSVLTVYLKHNNIYCNVDICWMKYMERDRDCKLSQTVSGTSLVIDMGNCKFCGLPAKWKDTNFTKIQMIDLGCGHGDLRLDYGPEVPLDHVDLYERFISTGSDSNLTSCFELGSIPNGELHRLKFTYIEDSVNVLSLTVIGHNLTCNKPDEFMLLYKDFTDDKSRVYRLCILQAQSVDKNRDHCYYECKCYNTVVCEIKILIIQQKDRILCDIIPTGSDKFVT